MGVVPVAGAWIYPHPTFATAAAELRYPPHKGEGGPD